MGSYGDLTDWVRGVDPEVQNSDAYRSQTRKARLGSTRQREGSFLLHFQPPNSQIGIQRGAPQGSRGKRRGDIEPQCPPSQPQTVRTNDEVLMWLNSNLHWIVPVWTEV